MDHINWEETYPRIKIWHDAMLDPTCQSGAEHHRGNHGFLQVISDWEEALPNMVKMQYCEDRK